LNLKAGNNFDWACTNLNSRIEILVLPKVWSVEVYLDDLESLTPARGLIRAEVQGNMLFVEGNAETVVNLCCDRCLNSFNQFLSFNEKEMIWIGNSPPEQLP